MRFSLIILCFLICFPSWGATKYVRTDGNDTASGNNDTSDPTTGAYRTINKGVASINGGDTLYIGDGTYNESTTLSINRGYASMVVITSTSGNASGVIITGTKTDFNANTTVQTSNVTLSNLTFNCFNTTNSNTLRIFSGTNILVVGCYIRSSTDAVNKPAGLSFGNGNPLGGFRMISSTIDQTGTNTAIGIAGTGSGGVGGFSFSNVTVRMCGNVLSTTITDTNWFFTNCTLVSSNAVAINLNSGNTNVVLDGCYVSSPLSAILLSAYTSGVLLNNCDVWATNNNAIRFDNTDNLTVTNSRLTSLASDAIHQQTAAACPTITISSCTITSSTDCINIQQSIPATIRDCSLSANSGRTITLGLDNVYAAATASKVTGAVSNCVIRSATGHGILLGANCTNSIAISNTIYGGDHGIVLKENIGSSALFNTVYGGTSTGIYSKGATNSIAAHNTIYAPAGYGLQVYVGDSGNKNYGVSYTNNWVSVSGTGAALNWTTAGDAGAGVCDYNAYFFRKAPAFGTVRAAGSIGTVEAVRAAWSGYGVAGNDSHSWYGPTLNPGFAQ